jgi:hypothetical protein
MGLEIEKILKGSKLTNKYPSSFLLKQRTQHKIYESNNQRE